MHSLKIILSKSKYFSVAWVFASLNFMIGTWVLYIPSVKLNLSLNDSEIGLALFFSALGVLVFLPLVPYITKRVGLGRYTLIGVVLFAVSFIAPLLAPNYLLLCISLFISGVFLGTTDVSMNALISEMEKEDSRNIMSAAHGFFSLGGAVGALLGSFMMPFFTHSFHHMVVTSLFIVVTNIFLSKYYFGTIEKKRLKQAENYQFKLLKPLFAIAFIAFVIMMNEGAIENWSTLYLIEVVAISQSNLAGLGFIVFSTTMTIGRFFGDGISEKIGSLKIILWGCVLGCIGYGCILSANLLISLLGFGILGSGLSVIVPELFRIAGREDGIKASVGISFVSGIGFIGFLLGPVFLGYISNSFNLKISFYVLLCLTVLALIISFLRLQKH